MGNKTIDRLAGIGSRLMIVSDEQLLRRRLETEIAAWYHGLVSRPGVFYSSDATTNRGQK